MSKSNLRTYWIVRGNRSDVLRGAQNSADQNNHSEFVVEEDNSITEVVPNPIRSEALRK